MQHLQGKQLHIVIPLQFLREIIVLRIKHIKSVRKIFLYSNETLLADDHAFVLKIKDTVRAAISEARFAQVVSRMRESTEAMLDTKQLPAIVKLASSSFGITEDESNGVLEHLITGGDFSLYGLANAVTRFSQDVESYDRATKLEEIGYSVMQSCWRRCATSGSSADFTGQSMNIRQKSSARSRTSFNAASTMITMLP